MKKLTKLLASLTFCCILMFSTIFTALAADATITFSGQSAGFKFVPGSEYTQTDLFGNFKDVLPGDTLTETITATNNAADCDYIKLYMRAVAHDGAGNPLTYSEAFENVDGKDQTGIDEERDESVVTMADFLAQLSMKVYNGETVIYDAALDELGGLAENVLLGTLRQGENAILTVELKVPIELGNEYADRVGEVDWVFLAETFDDPEPNDETISISDQSGTGANTGDSNNLPFYVGLVVLCVVIGCVWVIYRKLQKDKK